MGQVDLVIESLELQMRPDPVTRSSEKQCKAVQNIYVFHCFSSKFHQTFIDFHELCLNFISFHESMIRSMSGVVV